MKKTNDLAPLKEILKQNIQPKAQRIRRCEKRTKFYRQNSILKIEKKKFYRKLEKKQVNVEKPLIMDKIGNFWGSICGIQKDYNENAQKGREKGREKMWWIRRTCMGRNSGGRSTEGSRKISEMGITRNRQSSQLLVEPFQFHSHKYNQLF